MSNDDMFIMTSLSNADFHHPLLGPSLRLDPSPGLLVKPDIPRHLQSAPGEWGGLQHANVLLSGRFASRSRMYMHHLPKPLRKSLVDEASIMFSHQLADASTRGFRESKRGRADVEMSWLVSHLGIERWREALLWSFVVARVGGVDGVWSEASRTELRRVLGLSEGDNTTEVVVEKSARETLKDVDRIVDQAGWERPKHTDNLWCKFSAPRHRALIDDSTSVI
jgi:3-O-alpha-D-mannopyranosyl-alpha-D-mannopyranose xylosylphosphotransferase